jgi:alkylated DNA nucleotide flippase Atl1
MSKGGARVIANIVSQGLAAPLWRVVRKDGSLAEMRGDGTYAWHTDGTTTMQEMLLSNERVRFLPNCKVDPRDML